MKRNVVTLALMLVSTILMVACSSAATPTTVQPPVVNTVVVTVETIVEGTPIIETVVVTATPDPNAPTDEVPVAEPETSADPTTYFAETFGDPEGFDPALAYESAGIGIIEQTYEGLVTYNRNKADELVPQLAEAMPEISDDGVSYTFTIRKGITFHEGGDLTAEDVAYSFQRGLLQGGFSSPQLLLTEPVLGVGISTSPNCCLRTIPKLGTKQAIRLRLQRSNSSTTKLRARSQRRPISGLHSRRPKPSKRSKRSRTKKPP